jgi:hypothetical protein
VPQDETLSIDGLCFEFDGPVASHVSLAAGQKILDPLPLIVA